VDALAAKHRKEVAQLDLGPNEQYIKDLYGYSTLSRKLHIVTLRVEKREVSFI
jgi:hypothetical protein